MSIKDEYLLEFRLIISKNKNASTLVCKFEGVEAICWKGTEYMSIGNNAYKTRQIVKKIVG